MSEELELKLLKEIEELKKEIKNLKDKKIEQNYLNLNDSELKEFVNNSKNESLKDNYLSKFSEIIKEFTNTNYHTKNLLLIAYIVEDRELLEVTKAINTIKNYPYYIDLNEFKHNVYQSLMNIGREKFGKDNWKKYIESFL